MTVLDEPVKRRVRRLPVIGDGDVAGAKPATGKAAAAKPGARPARTGAAGARAARAAANAATDGAPPGAPPPELPPEWRQFVGQWFESLGCRLEDVARGDWEVELSPWLQRKWRRQRVRLVFDASRPTLTRGAWYAAPGSAAGRKILYAALDDPMCARRTALAKVPGAPESGLAAHCRVRGLTWGPARLGAVRYERRLAFHAVLSRWGGLPSQEAWVVLVDAAGECVEVARGYELPDLRTREGLYQINDALTDDAKDQWMTHARRHLDTLVAEREEEWEREIARLRDDEVARLSGFFAARIEEEEDRLRRRTSAEEIELEGGDATSLKLDWERRAAEVRHRWEIRSEVRLWGLEEWSWPVADLEQEVRAGAMRVRLTSRVDVARGLPAAPRCPTCGESAEMLVRVRGSVGCARCA